MLTVRADFYNPLIRNPLLSALLPRQQVNIPPMRREDLRSAIETPAKQAGLSFAPPQLVDQILDDVGLEEGRLPLLQFALKETWGKREGDRLTAEAYTAVGGVARAIEKTAEDAYERLTPAQKDAARRLFLRLVTPGEGQADTRARSEIPDDPEQRDIVNRFSNPKTRLLVTALQAAGPTGGETRATVEVAHEALIQRWPTLRDWVRANRDNMRARAAILRAKAEWEENRNDDKFLLDPGVQLERGRALLANPGDVAVDDIRAYVGRSIKKDERRLDAEREAAVAAQKRIADARKRTAQVAVGGLAAALLVAALAVWQYFAANEAKSGALKQRDRAVQAEDLAYKEKREAQASADQAKASAEQAKANLRDGRIAQSHFLAGLANQKRMAEGDAASAILLALEALPDTAAPEADRPYVLDAELQLYGALRDLRELLVLDHGSKVARAAFSPDDKRIVTASLGETTRQWDAETGEPISEPLTGHMDAVLSGPFSPDGQRIVTIGSAHNAARILDAATGKEIGVLTGHSGQVLSAAFSPDGKRIVTASFDKTARVRDAETGQPVCKPLTGHDKGVTSAAFSPDGARIVTASYDKTARRWDAATGEPIGEPLRGHDGQVVSAAFSPDGQRIVTASRDNTARIWDAATGQPVGVPLRGHGDWVESAAFSPDSKRIVTTSLDRTARIWDAATGQPIGGPLGGHDGEVVSAAFGASGKRIVTASSDNTARVWDVAADQPIEAGQPIEKTIIRHKEWVITAKFSPTASASSPRLGTRRRDCGTRRPASRSASRSAVPMGCRARRSPPTARASSPHARTRRRSSGMRRPASRSASRSDTMRWC